MAKQFAFLVTWSKVIRTRTSVRLAPGGKRRADAVDSNQAMATVIRMFQKRHGRNIILVDIEATELQSIP